MSVKCLLILIILCTFASTGTGKKNNYKHILLKDTEQKEELVDKFLELVEASWDYAMQLLYYKANILGLDKEREGNDHHDAHYAVLETPVVIYQSIPGSWVIRDVFMEFMDIILEDDDDYSPHQVHGQQGPNKKKKPRPHQNRPQHGGGHNRPQHGGHKRPQQSSGHDHLAALGSLLHHGRSYDSPSADLNLNSISDDHEKMTDSGLHKLLVRWKLCE